MSNTSRSNHRNGIFPHLTPGTGQEDPKGPTLDERFRSRCGLPLEKGGWKTTFLWGKVNFSGGIVKLRGGSIVAWLSPLICSCRIAVFFLKLRLGVIDLSTQNSQ